MRIALIRTLLSSTALTFALCSMAAGNDTPVLKAKAQPTVPTYDWSGFYVGGHAGYGVGTGHMQMIRDTSVEDLRATGPRGGLWGVQAGYNFQLGRMVYGIEGDWSWVNASRSNGFLDRNVDQENTVAHKIKSLGSVRGRVGIAADQMLFYATFGWGWARAEFDAFDADLARGDSQFQVRGNVHASGLVFGGGAEWALGNGLSLRAEYLRYAFGKSVGPMLFNPNRPHPVASYRFDSVDVARLGLNYRFFRPLAAQPAPAAATYWTGLYAGGHVGYGVGATTTALFRDNLIEDFKAEGVRGGLWGAQVGYNQQIGRAVVGIEADWTWLNASRNNTYAPRETLPAPLQNTKSRPSVRRARAPASPPIDSSSMPPLAGAGRGANTAPFIRRSKPPSVAASRPTELYTAVAPRWRLAKEFHCGPSIYVTL